MSDVLLTYARSRVYRDAYTASAHFSKATGVVQIASPPSNPAAATFGWRGCFAWRGLHLTGVTTTGRACIKIALCS